jgi:hypothetical protein
MFHSDLYSVIDDLVKRNHDSSTECLIELDGRRYRVEAKVDADDRPYFMIRLPFDVNNAALQLQHKSYTLNDIHVTVYRNRGGEYGILCPHITGSYKDVTCGENITLRGYLADGDFVQLNTLRASTSRKNSKKKTITTDLPNFFETQIARQLFTAHVVPYVSSLMVFLREHQTKLSAPLEQAYTTQLAELTRLHDSIRLSADDALIAKRIEVSASIVDITASLSRLSKTQNTWRGLNLWHQQQHDNYLMAEKTFSKPVSGTSEKRSDVVTETEEISPIVKSVKPQPSESRVKAWDAALAETNTLLATVNLTATEAGRLQVLIEQLDAEFIHSDIPIVDEQYILLSLMLDAKAHLSQYCFDKLRRGDVDRVRPYVMHLSRIPAHEVEAYLTADKHEVLSFLLENNLLSIYDKSSCGKLFYSLAYEQESLKCINLYANHGVHLYVMASDVLIPLFSDERMNASRLRHVLSQLDRVNIHLQQTLGVSTWVVLIDNLLRTLRATRHDLLEPAKKSRKHTKNPETDTTQALGFGITMIEILQYLAKLFSEEEIEVMAQYGEIASLAPLINLFPKQGVITLNFASIVSILTPIKAVLSTIKTQLNDLSLADRIVLKDLIMSATVEMSLGSEAEQQAAAENAFMRQFIRCFYDEAYKNVNSAVRSKAGRHQQAVKSIVDIFINPSMMLEIGLPPAVISTMAVACQGMSGYMGAEQITAFVEGMLTPDKTKQEQAIAFIFERCHINDRDMKAVFHAIEAMMSSGTSLYTVEHLPEARSIQALNSPSGPGSFKAKTTSATGWSTGFLNRAKKDHKEDKEDGAALNMG